ncbi:hypothetical protein SynROS8604_00229 [Synechococcus sp. ROS8604]|nr:hypothetical protein SynROS8604_00229 [Synechococcus sp. ROS8604]
MLCIVGIIADYKIRKCQFKDCLCFLGFDLLSPLSLCLIPELAFSLLSAMGIVALRGS